MKNYHCIWILSLTLCLLATKLPAELSDSSKSNILILHSYHHQFKWNKDISDAIIEELHPEYGIFQKYMDTKRNLDSIYLNTLEQMLKRQHILNNYKLVIVTDNNAFEFGKKNQQKIFEGIPIVFCGVNHITQQELTNYPNITGVNEDISILKNIELIKRLQPQADTLVVIIDQTITGQRITNEIFKINQEIQIPFKHVRIINNVSMAELEKKTAKISKKCAILFGPFFRDSDGAFYDFDDGSLRISKVAKVPVFGMWDFSLGFGIIGGYLTDGSVQGKEAAKQAKQILTGQKTEQIPIVWKGTQTYKFDYEQLKRFDIDLSLLPESSILINEPYSLLKHNPGIFNQIAATIAVLSTLSLLLIIISGRYRKLSKKYNRKNSYLKTVLNAVGDGIIEIDNHSIIKHMNPPAESITGVPEKEGKGQNIKYIYQPKPAYDTHGEVTHFTITNKHNKTFCITQTSTPIIAEEKKYGELITITDITTIIERKQQFTRLTENAKDLIYRIKIPEGYFEYISPASQTLLGYSPTELYKNPILIKNFVPKEWKPYVLRKWAELKSGKITGTYELQIQDKTGKLKWVNQRSVLVFNESGHPTHMEGIVTDITLQKGIEEELRESNIALEEAKERAEESDRLKSAFLANIAHEIRTPMNGIMGFSELLRNTDLQQGSQIRFIDIIQQSSKRMLNIIDDLVNIAQIEAGQIRTNIKPVHLANLVQETALRYQEAAKAKNIQFIHDNAACQKLNRTINTDPYKLNYAISKLLDNAVKYTKQGSVTLQCTIIDNRLWVAIKDTGIGIDEKHQQIIFDRFIQADNSPFKAEEGTGLGLAIARAFVETLGGKIKLQSQKDKGSTFEFYIPIEDASQ